MIKGSLSCNCDISTVAWKDFKLVVDFYFIKFTMDLIIPDVSDDDSLKVFPWLLILCDVKHGDVARAHQPDLSPY